MTPATSRRFYAGLRASRVRAVGTRFLQLRPWIAAVGTATNGAILTTSGAPVSQLRGSFIVGLVLVGGFAIEAAWLRRRPLQARWLFTSLMLTAIVLGLGCAVSGGIRSPVLPLLFAPVVIAFAAFPRGAQPWGISVVAVSLVALVAVDPLAATHPPIPAPYVGWMTLVSACASLVLMRIGLTGLADAYQSAGEAAARMREAVLADAASRAQDAELVGAKVAHEVRNPLTSIKGLVQLLGRRSTEPRDQKRVGVILEEVERIETILNGYLAFARPLRDLEVADVDLRVLLDEAALLLEDEAARQNVQITTRGAPVGIEGDPRRLREALLNLARNALEAMPDGGTLSFRIEVDEHIRVLVEDDGAGMDAVTLDKMGTPYFTTRSDGTGLGVTLARSAIRQHGGTLRYESEPAVGTLAIIELPRR